MIKSKDLTKAILVQYVNLFGNDEHLAKNIARKTKINIQTIRIALRKYALRGKPLKKYYCLEKACNNKISERNYYCGSKLCKSCSLIKQYVINKRDNKKEKHPLYGKKHNKITKEKISRANKGKTKGITRKALSEETKRKISLNHLDVSGEKNPNFKNWKSKEIYPIDFCEQLKELVRDRDNHICQICGKSENSNRRKLNIHHIDYDKKNLNPSNLISLCDSCHSKTNFNRTKWIAYFNKHRGILQTKTMECILHDIKKLTKVVIMLKQDNAQDKLEIICNFAVEACDKLYKDIVSMSGRKEKNGNKTEK